MLHGCVTPTLVLQQEEHTIAYFNKVKVAETDKVASILTCWKEPEYHNWTVIASMCLISLGLNFENMFWTLL